MDTFLLAGKAKTVFGILRMLARGEKGNPFSRAELERLCSPTTPEKALEGLSVLYECLSHSSWSVEGDLEAVNAAIEVLEAVVKGGK